MSSRPHVTFVVPCYNYAQYLPDCLRSILNQTAGSDFEILAIDDASTDDTLDVLRSFSDSRLRVIRHARNQGHASTINEGLSGSKGMWVARIDPDDRYRPGYLDIVLEKFAAHPEVGLVYGDAALIDSKGEITADRTDRVHGGRDFKGNELVRLLESNFICAPTVIARREAWMKGVPVPGHLAFNDWYFTVTMARSCAFYYVNEVLADYRVHGSNHHEKVVRNRSEEPSIFWLLNRIYSQSEADPHVEEQKRRARRRVYASHYLTLANKYFGLGMNSDARRCYLRALHYRQAYFRPSVVRRLAATFVGRGLYERSKSLFRSAAGL